MKELFNNSWKKIQQEPNALNEVIIFSGYFFFILLSVFNNNLFLSELSLAGLIFVLAILSYNHKEKSK